MPCMFWRYLYFFEKGNPQVNVAAIQGLIELIMTEMQSDTMTPDPAADAFLASTLRYIQFQKQKGGVVGEKYEPIKVWFAGWLFPLPCHVRHGARCSWSPFHLLLVCIVSFCISTEDVRVCLPFMCRYRKQLIHSLGLSRKNCNLFCCVVHETQHCFET